MVHKITHISHTYSLWRTVWLLFYLRSKFFDVSICRSIVRLWTRAFIWIWRKSKWNGHGFIKYMRTNAFLLWSYSTVFKNVYWKHTLAPAFQFSLSVHLRLYERFSSNFSLIDNNNNNNQKKKTLWQFDWLSYGWLFQSLWSTKKNENKFQWKMIIVPWICGWESYTIHRIETKSYFATTYQMESNQ